MVQASRIRDLVHAKLAGRKVDVIGFVDELLDNANEVSEMRCCLATDQALRFDLGDQACDVELDAARAKLRMLCAHLAELCSEKDGTASPYGGEGTIASRDTPPLRWTVRFKNTPDEQEFTIARVAATRNLASAQPANAAAIT